MSGLVEKVKQRVRSTSLHKRTGSQGSGGDDHAPANSDGVVVPPLPPANENNAYPAGGGPLQNSAFHVTGATGRPVSRQAGSSVGTDPYQETVAVTNGSIESKDETRTSSDIGAIIPDRVSSLSSPKRIVQTHGTRSNPIPLEGFQAEQARRSGTAPDREPLQKPRRHIVIGHSHMSGDREASSDALTAATAAMSRRSQHNSQDMPLVVADVAEQENFSPRPSATKAELSKGSISRKPLPLHTKRSVSNERDVEVSRTDADKVHPPMVESQQQSESSGIIHPSAGNNTKVPAHVNLPDDFVIQNTERTHVTEQVRPAVTQERILKNRTEIVQENITRDIHIHHYYTYIQPIKVVEVLPARHFIIDDHTGEKVEIEPPACWEPPDNFKPRQEDYSMVKGWTRHYLVDDQYPTGILEPAPSATLDHEVGNSNDLDDNTQLKLY